MPSLGKKKSIFGGRGWSILFSYLFRYKKEATFIFILSIVSAIGNGVVPYLVGNFFDALIEPSSVLLLSQLVPTWALFLGGWLLVQLIANAVDWLYEVEEKKVGTQLEADFLVESTNRLLLFPMSFHKTRRMGSTWGRMMSARSGLTDITMQVVLRLAPQVLSVIIGMAIVFSIEWRLGLVMISGVAIYLLLLIRIVPPIVELQKQSYKKWDQAYDVAYEALSLISNVKQATSEEYEKKRITKKFGVEVVESWLKVERIWSSIGFSRRFIIIGTQFVVFVVSVWFIQSGDLTIGQLISLNAYAGFIFGPFVALAMNWQVIQKGLVAIERADRILKNKVESHFDNEKVKPKEIRGDVAFKDVVFSYKKGKEPILRGVTFHADHGEIVALVGESGVGKSTAMELLSGYYFPQKGSVMVDGYSTRRIDLTTLRESVAVVAQEVALFNESVRNNIRYGTFKATDAEVEKAAKEAHAHEFISAFQNGYDQKVGERGIKLSVGQKQRIGIARAILRKPKILILDEPTSALDAKTEKLITESLEKLMQGRTTFIIAHRLSTVRKADRILVFKKGQIIEQGTHDALLKIPNGEYRRLYEFQIGLH